MVNRWIIMTKIIDVVFENGVLKPLKKVNFKEGEVLKIEIKKPKTFTKQYFKKLTELKNKFKKLDGAYKILEEIRNVSY